MSLVIGKPGRVEDTRIITAVAKATKLQFHKRFRYCTSDVEDCNQAYSALKGLGFTLEYFSGCFDPYLCHINQS